MRLRSVMTMMPGLEKWNTGRDATLAAVSCASAGGCGIVGYYYAGRDDQRPFVAKGSIAVHTSAALTLSTATVVYSREQSEKFSVTTKSANGLPATGTVAIRAGSTTVRTIERTGATLVPRTLPPAALIAGPGRLGPGWLGGSGHGP
jgi:hypothetical protein